MIGIVGRQKPKFENLVALFEQSTDKFGPRELFGTKVGDAWVWTTYAQARKLVDDFRAGLASLGVQRGDRVAIVSNNRVEWAVAAYATYGLGASFVPMYESQLATEWEFILRDCEAKVVIGSTAEIAEKLRSFMGEKVPKLAHVISLAGSENEPTSYKALLRKGAESPVPSVQPDASETACLVYTSGTTGSPKGVILSHGNIASNISAVHDLFPFSDDDRSLSFLPWAHSFGHTCELHCMLSMGASLGIAESVEKIVDNLAEVKPTILFSVPRIFNRIYNGVQKQMAEKPAPIRSLFYSGLRAAAKKRDGQALGMLESMALGLADKLVFTKIRARFGGRLKYAVSGAAALSKDVAEFVDGLGIMVYEGYGLTETSPIATANFPGNRKIGSVGKAIPGVRIVIDKTATEDERNGEIVIYGPNVMQGYHNRPDENAAVFTQDGGFRSGDMGYLDDEGYLYITGRIKEQYKLENGKYVVPTQLEEAIKLSPFVANVMVHGANKPYNVAIIVPDMVSLKQWAKTQGIQAGDEQLVSDDRVRTLFEQELEKFSGEFKGFEKVKRFVLVTEDFTQANGMLTPSLKLKRRNVLQRWGQDLDGLYTN